MADCQGEELCRTLARTGWALLTPGIWCFNIPFYFTGLGGRSRGKGK